MCALFESHDLDCFSLLDWGRPRGPGFGLGRSRVVKVWFNHTWSESRLAWRPSWAGKKEEGRRVPARCHLLLCKRSGAGAPVWQLPLPFCLPPNGPQKAEERPGVVVVFQLSMFAMPWNKLSGSAVSQTRISRQALDMVCGRDFFNERHPDKKQGHDTAMCRARGPPSHTARRSHARCRPSSRRDLHRTAERTMLVVANSEREHKRKGIHYTTYGAQRPTSRLAFLGSRCR
jgi:hypothetical protein